MTGRVVGTIKHGRGRLEWGSEKSPVWQIVANPDVVIRQATEADVDAVVALRLERARWLAERGSDQWTGGITLDTWRARVVQSVRAGRTWMATTRDGRVLGTMAVDLTATPGLWTAEELATAVMVHRLMVSVDAAGQGIGAKLLAHADQLAMDYGREWVRLDAWTPDTGFGRGRCRDVGHRYRNRYSRG